jgi:hypothetical protein
MTARCWSRGWGFEDVRARLEATLKRGTNVDAKDNHGLTPLMYCAVVGPSVRIGLVKRRFLENGHPFR